MTKKKTVLELLGIGLLLAASFSLVAAEAESPVPIDRGTAQSPAIESFAGSESNPSNSGSLKQIHADLSGLAPRLRVQLRTLRMQPGFRGTQLFKIERHMGKSQSALERLIKLEHKPMISPVHAHILQDDLRRQLKGLREDQSLLLAQVGPVHPALDEKSAKESKVISRNSELLSNLSVFIELLDKALEISQSTYAN